MAMNGSGGQQHLSARASCVTPSRDLHALKHVDLQIYQGVLFVEIETSGSSTPETCADQLQITLSNMLAKANSIPPLRQAAFGLDLWTHALSSPNKGNLD